jgi:hypothetical protein
MRKKYKRINIMGAAPGWEDTPVNEGEIWAVNDCHQRRNDVDLAIDVHRHCLKPTEAHDKKSLRILKENGTAMYCQDKIKGYPNIKKYPLEEIKKEFDTDYFGSGIDYIIALAIYEGATEIHLYGIIMARGKEYSHQKPSVEFWLGMAKGRGVKVRVHGEFSEILKTRNYLLYGYELPQTFVEKDEYQLGLLEMLKSYED